MRRHSAGAIRQMADWLPGNLIGRPSQKAHLVWTQMTQSMRATGNQLTGDNLAPSMRDPTNQLMVPLRAEPAVALQIEGDEHDRIGLLPAALQEILATIPAALIKVEFQKDTPILNRVQTILEGHTGFSWDWWLLQPPLYNLQSGERRIVLTVSQAVPLIRPAANRKDVRTSSTAPSIISGCKPALRRVGNHRYRQASKALSLLCCEA